MAKEPDMTSFTLLHYTCLFGWWKLPEHLHSEGPFFKTLKILGNCSRPFSDHLVKIQWQCYQFYEILWNLTKFQYNPYEIPNEKSVEILKEILIAFPMEI